MLTGLILQLFATFFVIGLFTFGGGYAMLPALQREVVEKAMRCCHSFRARWW